VTGGNPERTGVFSHLLLYMLHNQPMPELAQERVSFEAW